MHDSLANGRPIRTVNILDEFTREGLWIEVDISLPAARVVRILVTLVSGEAIHSSCASIMVRS